jgi:hypothetical protein
VVVQNIDPKPKLSAAALQANMEHYRARRIQAHTQYLNYKRQERFWREQLQRQSDSLSL